MTDGGQRSDDGTARPVWPVSDAEAEPDAEREYRPSPSTGGTRWTQPAAAPRGRHGLVRTEGLPTSADTPPAGLRRPAGYRDTTGETGTPALSRPEPPAAGWREPTTPESDHETPAPALPPEPPAAGWREPTTPEPDRETPAPALPPEPPAASPRDEPTTPEADREPPAPVFGRPEPAAEPATSGDAPREAVTPVSSPPEAPAAPSGDADRETAAAPLGPPEAAPAPATPGVVTREADEVRPEPTPAPTPDSGPVTSGDADPEPVAAPVLSPPETPVAAPGPTSAFAQPDAPAADAPPAADAKGGAWGPPDAPAQQGDTVWAHPPREPSAFGGPATTGAWGRPDDEPPANPWAPQAATGASPADQEAGDTVWAHVPRPIGDKPDAAESAAQAPPPPAPSPWGPPTAPQAAAGPPAGFTQPDEPRPEGYQPVDAVPPAAWNADIGTPAPPGPPPGKPKRRRRAARGVAVAAACLLAGALGGAAAVEFREDDFGGGQTVSLPPVPAADIDRPADSVAGVAKAVLPTVVAIKVRAGADDGTGSGFVIDPQGYILTNNHVVTAGGNTPSSRIDVVFQDGTQVQAQLVGRDDSYDLAVLRVERQGPARRPARQLGQRRRRRPGRRHRRAARPARHGHHRHRQRPQPPRLRR